MEWIKYKLQVDIQYEKKVSDEYFQLRCLPRNDEVQQIVSLEEKTEPEKCMAKKRVDGERNSYILGYIADPHDHIFYQAEGVVQVSQDNRKPESEEMLYRISSTYTEVGPTLGEWYGQMNLPEGEVKERALWIANFVKRKMRPSISFESEDEKSVKERLLTADQAAQQGFGSCRDYAQIMIALCHMDGITARYVTGILPGKNNLHAWVEVQGEDGVYYGLDPMEGCPVTDLYVALCSGRDGKECSLSMSGAEHSADRTVNVFVDASVSEKPEYSLMPEDSNTHWLAKKMALRNSSFRSIPLDRLNSVMNNLEFTILSILRERSMLDGSDDKLFVRDVAEWLNIPVARLSPIFNKMEEHGYIHWDSDPDEGASFLILTDYGKKRLEEQQNIMIQFYEHVIERFGRGKARELDKLMLELESLLRDELDLLKEKKEGAEHE